MTQPLADHARDPIGVAELLRDARRMIARMTPADAFRAAGDRAAIVDIRSETQIGRDGQVPGAHVIPRNVLEWRLDPASPHRVPELATRSLTVIVLCDEGYQSSLAAANLARLGFRAADVIGGFQAWKRDGLPTVPPRA